MTTTKNRIGYVDEEQTWTDKFQLQLKEYFDIKTYIPKDGQTLDGLTTDLIDDNLDAIVIDYELSEAQIVPFNGDELVNSIRKVRPLFPLFILTSKDEEMVLGNVEDNEIVRLKDELSERPQILAHRISNKIDNYHKSIEEAKEKIHQYAETRQEGKELTPEQEEDLFHQYQFLEKVDPEDKLLPDALIAPGSVKALNDLVEQTRNYLDELKKTSN